MRGEDQRSAAPTSDRHPAVKLGDPLVQDLRWVLAQTSRPSAAVARDRELRSAPELPARSNVVALRRAASIDGLASPGRAQRDVDDSEGVEAVLGSREPIELAPEDGSPRQARAMRWRVASVLATLAAILLAVGLLSVVRAPLFDAIRATDLVVSPWHLVTSLTKPSPRPEP